MTRAPLLARIALPALGLCFACAAGAQDAAPAATGANAAPANSYVAYSFYSDRKAYRPGDVLTVLITEVATATSTARTRTDKEENAFARFFQQGKEPWTVDAAIGSDFDGGGDIARSGRLLARLAVVVQSVDAQGNLQIRGEQEIHLNDEQQRIQLEGFVRAEDVAFDNTVPSWRVSAARIDFVGEGVLARRQRPGLFTRILDLFRLN